jgi:hypothetical protein
LYELFIHPMNATCFTHFIFLDFIAITILGEENKVWSSSLCNFIHCQLTSAFLHPYTLINAFCS